MAFVKLDTKILNSTTWLDADACKVFITALLMAEPYEVREPIRSIQIRSTDEAEFVVPVGWYGFVPAAGPGIAYRAIIEQDRALDALERLASPDPGSRTPDHNGRRMVRVSGGYLILNYIAHRDRDHGAAERQARFRTRQKMKESNARTVTPVTHADADADAESDTSRAKSKATVRATPAPSRFDEFWQSYPNKKGRKDAERHWKREGCDAVADALLAHVALMQREDTDWLRGAIPMGSTYINGRRWEDQPKRDKAATPGAYTTPSPNKGPSETPVERAVNWARQQHHMGQIDAAERDRLISAATEKHRGRAA